MFCCILKIFIIGETLSSIFERINHEATLRKQAAWAAYTPLTLEQLGKEHHTHDKGTREPQYAVIVRRVTESLAIKHALGWFRFMSEDPVLRIEPVSKARWCTLCRKHHALEAFEHDTRVPSGIAFGCKLGRREIGKYFSRRVDKLNARALAKMTQ